ncbi:MurR/RpiR family transcriptional regulator [Clostridium sardiniense]|uniref:MurR/RpiR family transcriptional regulator n=1 Tax=Clostridium sardiniense TaxID=29369 RepID=UPI003D350BBF
MIINITKDLFNTLTGSEKAVVEFINNNSEKLINMSIVDMAELTYTSPATVSRAIKKCGLEGFAELRYKISKENKSRRDYKNVNDILGKSLIEAVKTIENISVEKIIEATKILSNSRRVYILARGLSELVAEEFDLKLKLLGYNTFLIKDPNIMRNLSKKMNREETIIVFSLKGETAEIVESVINSKECGCKVISCCCSSNTILNEISDIYLLGRKHAMVSIKDHEVTSRLPLYIISRGIIDYLIITEKNENN